MKTKTLGFIGGGRITRIILQAFANQAVSFDRMVVFDLNENVLNSLRTRFPRITVASGNLKEAAGCDMVFIALHPPAIMETLAKIKDHVSGESVVISLAPKITIGNISAALGGIPNVVRMNPSASAIVNKGVNPVAFNMAMQTDVRQAFLELMSPLGSTPVVDESKIEAYAVISAMGHTYFFFQFQHLKELATGFGMDEQETRAALSGMIKGTVDTLFSSGLSYNEVDDLVPVKPMAEAEETIKGLYTQYLTAIYNKIKP